jgi:hypothetical protein
MAKKKSKRWSLADIKTIKKFVLTAQNEGLAEHVGLQAAATHFGVTLNSVNLRWGRFNKGQQVDKLKKNTTKIPMVRKKRKYNKRLVDVIIDDNGIAPVKRKYTKRKGAATLIDNIKRQAQEEVETFRQKQSTTRELRKMVIDLMDTSGHIKAVSVHLSTKSFTVSY